MTGFGTSTYGFDESSDQIKWELRSVNAKGLDIRLKLPSGFEALEGKLKRNIQDRFKRGTIQAQCVLIKSEASRPHFAFDENAIENYLLLRRSFEKKHGPFAPIDFDAIALDPRFQMSRDLKTSTDEGLGEALIAALEPALDALEAARLSEGAKLHNILSSIITQITKIISDISVLSEKAVSEQTIRLKPKQKPYWVIIRLIQTDWRKKLYYWRLKLTFARKQTGFKPIAKKQRRFLKAAFRLVADWIFWPKNLTVRLILYAQKLRVMILPALALILKQ